MGEVVRIIPNSELERARLIREARAIYDSIFPPDYSAGEDGNVRHSHEPQPGGKG